MKFNKYSFIFLLIPIIVAVIALQQLFVVFKVDDIDSIQIYKISEGIDRSLVSSISDTKIIKDFTGVISNKIYYRNKLITKYEVAAVKYVIVINSKEFSDSNLEILLMDDSLNQNGLLINKSRINYSGNNAYSIFLNDNEVRTLLSLVE